MYAPQGRVRGEHGLPWAQHKLDDSCWWGSYDEQTPSGSTLHGFSSWKFPQLGNTYSLFSSYDSVSQTNRIDFSNIAFSIIDRAVMLVMLPVWNYRHCKNWRKYVRTNREWISFITSHWWVLDSTMKLSGFHTLFELGNKVKTFVAIVKITKWVHLSLNVIRVTFCFN